MTCNKTHQKSTLDAYTDSVLSLAVAQNIRFDNAEVTGCSICFNAGGTVVTLRKAGLYHIIFNTFGASQVSGNIRVDAFKNGVIIPGAVASANSSAVTDIEDLSFSTIVEVLPSCGCVCNDAEISIRNTGVVSTLNSVHLNVIKLC